MLTSIPRTLYFQDNSCPYVNGKNGAEVGASVTGLDVGEAVDNSDGLDDGTDECVGRGLGLPR